MIFLLLSNILLHRNYSTLAKNINDNKIYCKGRNNIEMMSSYFIISCFAKDIYTFSYDEFEKTPYEIHASSDLIDFHLEKLPKDNPDKYMSIVIPSLVIDKYHDVVFRDFYNTTKVDLYLTWFKDEVDAWIYYEGGSCHWESWYTSTKNHPNEVINENWKQVCFVYSTNLQSFLHYDKAAKIKYISKVGFILIVIFTVLIIVGMLVSLYFIGKRKYDKERIGNSSELP